MPELLQEKSVLPAVLSSTVITNAMAGTASAMKMMWRLTKCMILCRQVRQGYFLDEGGRTVRVQLRVDS